MLLSSLLRRAVVVSAGLCCIAAAHAAAPQLKTQAPGPTLGNLLASLAAAGYKPEQVDAVLITHMHADHVGGLMADGKPAFPNATVHADQADADFWLSAEKLAAAPEAMKGFFQGALASMNPYVSGAKFKPFQGATNLFAGIRAVATPGHTPGHTVTPSSRRGKN